MLAKDYRQSALQRLNGHWGDMILISFIYTVIMGVLSYTGIGALILGGPFVLGLATVMLKLIRVGKVQLENLFDGFKGESIGNTIVTYILYTVYLMLWTMLFFIPGLVKAYSYAMTFYILHDEPTLSANEAITRSRQMMDGNKMRLFCLHLSFIGWILLACLTCGIGFIVLTPYMSLAQAEFYESLKQPAGGFVEDAPTA